MRRATVPVLLLALGLGLTVCGDRPGAGLAGAGPAAAGTLDADPLDAYEMTPAETHTVAVARWTLAKECMRGLGFDNLRDLDPAHPPGRPQRPADGKTVFGLMIVADRDHRYGVQNPEEAATYGYRAPAAEYRRAAPDRKWTLPEYLALTGAGFGDDPRSVHGHPIPERGCLGRADLRIYGRDRYAAPDPVLTLRSESRRRAQQDPAWTHADRLWSACMRGAGYHYATPREAQNGDDRRDEDLKRFLSVHRPDDDRPSEAERRTAVADARCKRRTGWVRTVRALDVREQAAVIAEHRPALEEARARARAAARTAGGIVRDG
ncbi:hypothetical protein [Streptomyces sp. NPDC021356]|uniref:hypothetical protein n=1 Tax=Streptomyces sp. NPDC021356 TaxID=3154900 RepID=UPI0033E12A25